MNRRDEGAKYLAHYASPYYDPQKAHDYYIRTRQLADKNAQSALTSKAQRDIFAVSRDSIATARKNDITAAQEAQKARVDALRQKAQETADNINATLQALAEKLKGDLQSNANVQLNVIPPDATPRQRAFLERQNAILQSNAARAAQRQLGSAQRKGSLDRQKIVSDLQGALKTASEDYKNAMQGIKDKYDSALETEKQNIHDQIAGAPPKKIASKSGSSASSKSKAKKKSSGSSSLYKPKASAASTTLAPAASNSFSRQANANAAKAKAAAAAKARQQPTRKSAII